MVIKRVYSESDSIEAKTILFSLIAFIGLNQTLIEQVIWPHIQGYLFFVLLILSSFYFLLNTENNSKKYLPAIWLLILIASFTHELGQIIAIVAGLYLFFVYRKTNLKLAISNIILFFSIPIIYQLINWIDLKMHFGGTLSLRWYEIFINFSIFKNISNSIQLLGYTTLHPLIPSLARYSFASRLIIGDLRGANFNIYSALSIITVVSLFIISILGARSLLKSHLNALINFLFLAFFTYIGYIGLVVFGRLTSTSSPTALTSSSYYAYIGFILFFVFLIPLLVAGLYKLKNNMPKMSKIYILFLILLIWVVNLDCSRTLFRLNSGIKVAQAELINIASDTRAFLKKQDSNVKIYFDLENSDAIQTFHGVSFTTLLFRDHEDNLSPQYIATFKDGKITFKKIENWSDKPNYYLGPILVKVGPVFNIYSYNHEFFALHHLEGSFIPSKKDYKTLLKAHSFPEISELSRISTGVAFKGLSPKGHEPIYIFEDNYKGYQLVRAFGLFYAIPFNETPFDLFKLTKKSYSSVVFGKSIADLEVIIKKQRNMKI